MRTEPELRTAPQPFPTIDGKYLSVTSYRSDGAGVATPVWFVRDGQRLLVETDAESFKVKRIRRHPAIAIAPCSARGKLQGPKITAYAEILEDDPKRFETLFKEKYRVDLLFFRPLRAIQKVLHLGPNGTHPVTLAITPA